VKRVRFRRAARAVAVLAAALLTAGALWLFWPSVVVPELATRVRLVPTAPAPVPPPSLAVELVATLLAVELRAPTGDEARDVAALRGLLGQFTTALRLAERTPLGDNADIAVALTGRNRRRIAFLPHDHPALRGGLLVDRSGTPYHFHARSADVIDVRSAGEDRVLFTADDLVAGGAAGP
jgi:hypothetical protein